MKIIDKAKSSGFIFEDLIINVPTVFVVGLEKDEINTDFSNDAGIDVDIELSKGQNSNPDKEKARKGIRKNISVLGSAALFYSDRKSTLRNHAPEKRAAIADPTTPKKRQNTSK